MASIRHAVFNRIPRSNPGQTGCTAVLTTYFNPCKFKSRSNNYNIFRDQIGPDLFTIELAFEPETFELEERPNVLRILGGRHNIMWQKERLLNLLLARIPTWYTNIAWVDCDIIFNDSRWRQNLNTVLDQYVMVQLFDTVAYLGPNGEPQYIFPGIVRFLEDRHIRNETDFLKHTAGDASPANGKCTGIAWAARREIFDQVGFLDCSIIGGGDLRMVLSGFGAWNLLKRHIQEGEPMFKATRQWGQTFYALAQGSMSYVPGTVKHLFHGEIRDRRYSARTEILKRYGFDPFKDITLSRNGLWEWKDSKSPIVNEIISYFQSRKEDG